MSEKKKGNEEEKEISRRSILGSIGLGATGSFGLFADEVQGKTPELPHDLVELEGQQRKQAIIRAKSTDDFGLLRKHFEEVHGFTVDESDVEVYRLVFKDKNRAPGTLVTFGLENKAGNSSPNEAKLGLSFTNDTLFDSKGQLLWENDGEIELNFATVSNGRVETKNKKIPESTGVQGENVSPQAVGQCTACKEIVKYACEYGCGLSATAICLAIGLANVVAGAACSVIAEVVCNNIDLAEDCRLPAGQVCYDLGYCDTPPL